jgi:hypothetical protein
MNCFLTAKRPMQHIISCCEILWKPLDEKWKTTSMMENKMQHVSFRCHRFKLNERRGEKNEFTNLHIFRFSNHFQHISYLYIYVSIECFLILNSTAPALLMANKFLPPSFWIVWKMQKKNCTRNKRASEFCLC